MADDFAPNEWRALESLVDKLLDAAPDQRALLIEELSGGDAVRRAELERIVEECEMKHPLLDGPVGERFASLLDDETVSLPAVLAERYRIVRELGRGGMAIVYLANDIKHDRDVAVKIVRPSLVATLGRARFLREIAIAAKLKHPHILPLFDSGEVDGVLYYVMPYHEEQSLRERLRRDGTLPIDDTIEILSDVCDALAYAHEHGIVHRDIKPDNVLLSGRHAMVTDFGVARAVTAASEAEILTTAGRVVGTAAYMAPEQASGVGRADYRVDIYAVGVMAYEMLAGERPFSGETPASQRPDHMAAAALDLTKLRKEVPTDLAALVMRCLEPDPAARYQQAGEVVRDLASIAPGRPTQRTSKFAAKPSRAVVTWVLAVAAALVLGWAVWPSSRSAPHASAPRLAVLVFEHGTDSGLEPLAIGLSDNLIGALGAVPGLIVRSMNAVLPYRGTQLALDSLARLLDVTWFVGGRIYRAGDSTKASVELTDATGRLIARTTATTASGQDVRLLENLVPSIATLLRARVGDEVRVEGWRAGTNSQRAFGAINLAHKERRDGKQLTARGDVGGARLHYQRADSALEIAARADARWIEPLIQRATVALEYARLTFGSGLTADSARVAVQRGRAHAHAALRLDRQSSRAMEVTGMLLHEESGLISGSDSATVLRDSAERVLTRVSNADTTLVEAASLLSTIHFARGEYDQAYVMAERAYAADAYYRDPHEVLSRLFTYSFEDEEDADARRWCTVYTETFRDDWFAGMCRLTLMIWDARESPNADSAWAVARTAISAAPEVIRPSVRVQIQTLLAGVLARSGAANNARRLLADVDAAVQADPRVAREPFGTELLEIEAAVRLRLGQTDSAKTLLEELLKRDPDRRARLQRSRRFRDMPFERLRDAVGTAR